VVRYNYRPDELGVLVEFVAMIKGLSQALLAAEELLAPIMRQYLYVDVQTFLQQTLAEMIRHVTKKKRKDMAKYVINCYWWVLVVINGY